MNPQNILLNFFPSVYIDRRFEAMIQPIYLSHPRQPVCSKVVIFLLFIHCLLLPSLCVWGVCIGSLFCGVVHARIKKVLSERVQI